MELEGINTCRYEPYSMVRSELLLRRILRFEVPVDLRSLPVAVETWKFYAYKYSGRDISTCDPGLAYPTGL